MFKKIFLLTLLGIFVFSLPTAAVTGIEYLQSQTLTEMNQNYRSLAMVTKTLFTMGQDVTVLKSRMSGAILDENLITQAFSLMATSNPSFAAKIAESQTYDGSWNNDSYLTALITYVLEETNLEATVAQGGANYLRNHPNADGGWGNDGCSTPQDTALVLMVLKKARYNEETTKKGLQWLLLHQGGEGGWGNNINTAWACLALHEFGTNPDELEKAVDYLKMFINKDGGWGIYPGEASDPFTSATEYLNLYI